MSRPFFAIATIAALGACDGENPFQPTVAENADGDTETLDPTDPNTDVSNRFAFDPAQRLTLNSVELDDNDTPDDTTDDTLILNNLPFDGPDGVYVLDSVLGNGAEVYRSQQTNTTGTTLTFAVFMRSDFLEVTSAASPQWIDFGFAGANVNRESFNLPGGVGEYVYVGAYGATRTFSDRGGIEVVTGDVDLRLDVLDFDPNGNLQGAVDGIVSNRQREGVAGTLGLGELPNIIFAVTSFDTETGVWEAGQATTFLDNNAVRSSGTHDGLIAGPDGEELGGYSIITGAADVQTVRYEVVQYRVTTPTGVINPTTGEEIVSITNLTSSGLDDVSLEALQNDINGRQNLPDFLEATGVPDGAEVIETNELELVFTTEYDAREIGVFIGDQVPE